MLEGSVTTRASEFRAVPSRAHWKVGIDLGSSSTVYQDVYAAPGGSVLASRCTLPTVIGGGAGDAERRADVRRPFFIGEAALQRRDHLDVKSPFAAPLPQRVITLLGFARALRQEMLRERAGSPWGIIACPYEIDGQEERQLRAVGSELFERLLLVEEPYLLAIGILADPLREHALAVDVGSSGVRAALVGGLAEDAERDSGAPRRIAVAGGGAAIDERLKALLLERYPDLVLTDATAARIKEGLGFVRPAHRLARVRVMLGKAQRILDISEVVREACEPLAAQVLDAVHQAILRTPRHLLAEALGRIVLVGGGAALAGLPRKIEEDLHREGFSAAAVRAAEEPRGVLALGALKLALLTQDDTWETPLFAFN